MRNISTTGKWLLAAGLLAAVLALFIFIRAIGGNGPARNVQLWLTTADQKNLLTRQSQLVFSDSRAALGITIDVNSQERYQTMDGFGAAATGSSAFLMNQRLSASQRRQLLDELFTGKGIALSLIRHTIGASDYSVSADGEPLSYTYDDIAEGKDYALEHFSVKGDADVIELLRAAHARNSSLKLMGTPWTAPAWMKFGERTLNGWYLDYKDPEVYKAYANYFVKYIRAYEEEGLPVYAVTVQNEPGFTTPDYPSMSMGAEEQARFIRENLGPAFAANGIGTKIIGYDHNWDAGAEYAGILLGDSDANKYTDGTAFHCYAGTPDAMTRVHQSFPAKQIYFTECSGGEWSGSFGEALSWEMSNLIIGAPRNWAKTVLLWNLALDPEGGPENGGCTNCRGVVTIDPETGEVSKNVEYYALGHASKFVVPGAVRIESSQHSGQIETVAYENPDKSIVLIAANTGDVMHEFSVRFGSGTFEYALPPGAAVTFKW